MAEIVNLRRVRKTMARAKREVVADENRARFGTPSHARKLNATLEEKRKHSLDLHLIADGEAQK